MAALPLIRRRVLESEDSSDKDSGKNRSKRLFTEFHLTKDPDAKKYMDFSSVSFPKLYDPGRAETGSAIDNMWMVGFLDHEQQTEKENALKDIDHFMRLPGGRLLPGAAREVRRIYKREAARTKLKEAEKFAGLTAGQLRRVKGKTAVAARLSDDLILRLKYLAETHGGCEMEELSEKVRRKTTKKKSPFFIYGRENAKLRRAISERRPRENPAIVRSRAMEDLYMVEREHTEAAIAIQGCYRRYRRMLFWKEYLRKTRMATKIQKLARGMLVRIRVQRWYYRRSWLVTIAQAAARGMIDRHSWERRKRMELVLVTRIQSGVRRMLARIKIHNMRRYRGAVAFQRLWRGAVARVKADRMWLHQEVIKMQALVRGFLGRIQFRAVWDEVNDACIILQKRLRAMRVRRERSRLLWERDVRYRRELIDLLRVEDERANDEIRDIKKRIERQKLKDRIKKAKRDYLKKRDQVRRVEWDFLQLQYEYRKMSPRAVRQGWTKELERDKDEHRNFVTSAKLEAIFEVAPPYRKLVMEQDHAKEQINELKWKSSRLQQYRETELQNLWARESEVKWRNERRNARKKVADQKRRWRVKWYRDSGKPDKRRRPGHAWSPGVFAGPEKEQFFIGGVDVLSPQKEKRPDLLPGSKEGIKLLQNKVAMQTVANQVQQYQTLMQPLYEGMGDFSLEVGIRGFPPKKVEPVYDGLPLGLLPKYDERRGEIAPAMASPSSSSSKDRAFVSSIPWSLLDELEDEKAASLARMSVHSSDKLNS